MGYQRAAISGISSASKTNGFRESGKKKKSFLFGWTRRRCQKDFSRNQQKGGEAHRWLTVHWSAKIGDFSAVSWSHFDGNFDPIQVLKIQEFRGKCPVSFIFGKCATKFHVSDCISFAYVMLTRCQLSLTSYLRSRQNRFNVVGGDWIVFKVSSTWIVYFFLCFAATRNRIWEAQLTILKINQTCCLANK